MAILLAQVPGGWKAKTALAELYDIPEEYAEWVRSYVPNFSYFVIDLNEMTRY